jgi:ribosome-associated protein
MEKELNFHFTVENDEQGNPDSLSLAKAIFAVLDNRRGEDLAVIRVGEKIDLTDFFVLCTAQSNTHVKALCDEVEFRLEQIGIGADRIEGRGSDNSWMVMDYGCVLVHIFSRESREFYNLDKLYGEGPDARESASWDEQ